MTKLVEFAGYPLVHALGWTLLHFLWQGALVALVLWLVLGFLGGRSSQARYGAACFALVLMVAMPLITFARIASTELKARSEVQGSAVAFDPGILLQVGIAAPAVPWPMRMAAALDRWVPWLLAAWFAGAVFFAARLNFGLLVARRLKSAGTEAPPDELLRVFDALRVGVGVRRAVSLLHSARVQVPTVVGWLRPVVLIPASCLTGLSMEQIEAIFCHELAHVRRHDYLVSVFQSVAEALLFYQPAVWWVSKQVRRERECCCDEVAVGMGGDVLAYAKALSYLEERRAAFPEFVLGANGGVLTMRIRRLLGCSEDAQASQFAAFTLLALLVAAAGSYAVTAARAQSRSVKIAAGLHDEPVESTQASGEIALLNAPAPFQPAFAAAQQASEGGAPAATMERVYTMWVEQDVAWIITPEERDAFLRLTNNEERDAFVRNFWERRNPTPGSATNAFKDEHYARIAYSNEHFATDTKVGWRTDRGHIYIAYGKPESIDSHPTGGQGGYPFEVWHYSYIPGIGDKVDITFVDTCHCGDYRYTIDRPGQPGAGAGAESGQARAILASRLFAPGGAGVPQSAAPPPASGTAQEAGSISGVIVDPTGALVPRANVKTVNTDTGVTWTKATDNTGSFSFSPLPPGPYNVEFEAKGFMRTLQENVNVKAGQDFKLNMKLNVGAATQTLTVTGKPIAAAPLPPPPLPPVVAAAKPVGPLRVSSGTMAGNIISQGDPTYPADARAAHVQGVVVLHAIITKTGTIEKVEVVSGPPPLLVSAIDAVRQWKYKPYLLNGEPTEVETTININFTLGPPDMSCTYYNAGVGHAGTCEEGSTDKGHYYCRADDDKALVQSQSGCEWKVKRLQDLQHGNQLPTSIQTTPSPASGSASSIGPGAPNINVYNGVPLRKIGGGVSAPIVTFTVEPEMTPESKKAKFEGVVLVNLIVDAKGMPQNVHVLRGVGMGLDEKAIQAIRQYKFKPAMEGGEPVPVALNIEVNFKIF